MRSIVKYQNGNYEVILNTKTGTKIRKNNLDFFRADFPESFDLNITNKCDGECLWCYQGCTKDGAHADILNAKFLDSVHPYTEIAINGNDLSHPDLVPFLKNMRDKNIIVSMTVNQKHFMKNINFIKELIEEKLIYGLGISLLDPTMNFIDAVQQFPNAVIHVINGIVDPYQLQKLSHKNLKILILGYKEIGRGEHFYKDRIHKIVIDADKDLLYGYLPEMVKENWFEVISFDNLAIKQLEPQRLMSEEEWNEIYMGDDMLDGKMTSASMYIDLVNKEFAANSISDKRYPLMDNIEDMFDVIKND